MKYIKTFENFGEKNISDMTFDEFNKEYRRLAKYAQESEKKGKLDNYDPSYVPMTEEEKKLSETDWKAFSRQRGFSEDDINQYEKWYKISGQEDKIEGAINDPWRRAPNVSKGEFNDDYVKYIYNKFKGIEDNDEGEYDLLGNKNQVITTNSYSEPSNYNDDDW